MTATDLIPTLQRIEAEARGIESEARKPDGMALAGARAIIGELSGVVPSPSAVDPDCAPVVLLAKSVRILASMLAAGEGASIDIAGVLDDLHEAPQGDPRDARQRRKCLRCRRRFRSHGAFNRLCPACTTYLADDAVTDPHTDPHSAPAAAPLSASVPPRKMSGIFAA